MNFLFSKLFNNTGVPHLQVWHTCVVVSLASCSRPTQALPEILWDYWGIPHIYSHSSADSYYALGWAQMKSDANTLLEIYAEGRKNSLSREENDFFREELDSLDFFRDKYLRAFLEGINSFAEANPEKIANEYQSLLPVTSLDILVHFYGLYYKLRSGHKQPLPAAWAISRKKLAGATAVLLSTAIFPRNGTFHLYEVHLNTSDADTYGVAILGQPLLWAGFNEHLGWTHTIGKTGSRYRSEEDNFPTSFNQWHSKSIATSLAGFEAALKKRPLPDLNVTYIDKKGNIANFYYDQDSKLRLVRNPKTGWLGADIGQLDFRSQQMAKKLSSRQQFSFEELISYQQSTVSETANRILDDLLELKGILQDSTRKEAMNVLENWDRQTNPESKGAVLFARWFECLSHNDPYSQQPFARKWSGDHPLTTPDGLISPESALECLTNTALVIKSRFGRLDVPWGEVYRFRAGIQSVPAAGGMPWMGTQRFMDFEPTGEDSFIAHGENGFRMAVEFGHKVRAKVVSMRGNRTMQDHGKVKNQSELFANREMRDVWLNRSTIEANLLEKEILEVK